MKIEELQFKVENLEDLSKELLARTDGSRSLDHAGLSIVASEGLRGGGAIDRSRALALDVGGLDEGGLPSKNGWILFYNENEAQHFRIEFNKLVETIDRFLGFETLGKRVERLAQGLSGLKKDFEFLSLYDTLPEREKSVAAREEIVERSLKTVERLEGRIDGALRQAQTVQDSVLEQVARRESIIRRREEALKAAEATSKKKIEDLEVWEKKLSDWQQQVKLKEAELKEKLSKLRQIIT